MLPRTWQGRARLLLGVFTVAFGGVVFLAISSREERPGPPAATRADPSAVIESTGAVVIQAKGSTQDFRIEAERQLTYQDGTSRFEIVTVTVAERAGRTFVFTGREAEVADNQARVRIRGDVRLSASDDLHASTGEALYDDREGVLRAPGALQFSRGRLSGSGASGRYDRHGDLLRLDRDARVAIAVDESGGGGLEVTSAAATLARQDGYLRFEGGARIVRTAQVIEAATAVVHFNLDDQRIRMVELRGGSHISGGGPSPGALRGLSATDIDLLYGDDGQTVTQATLTGDASVDVSGPGGGAGRRVAAETLNLSMAPDGVTLTSIAARGRVRLDFEAEAGAPARRMTANAMDGRGEAGRGLTMVHLSDAVEFREVPAGARGAPPAERIARARTLDLSVAEGLGSVQEARFAGDVTFREGELQAEGPAARYQTVRGEIDLMGLPEAGRRPLVTDAGLAIEADRIDLTLAGRNLVAEGDVRTVSQGSGPRVATHTDDGATKRPAVLKQDAPVFVTGRHLVYDGGARHAVYTGDVRLWQGQTAIQGDRLVLDERTGNFTATGSARATLVLQQRDRGSTESVVSIATADELVYDDAQRRITYTVRVPPRPASPGGGRLSPSAPAAGPLAHVSGPQGDLTAETIELHLDAEASGLQRVEAYGTVTLRSRAMARPAGDSGAAVEAPARPPRARVATGMRMTYFAAEERYVMSGTPVAIIEECRETTGKSLTFFRSTDTIAVDGNEEIRTQTRAGETCPELK